MTLTHLLARRGEFDRRRAELYRRLKALKAPGRDATAAEERTFVAELDRLEVASDKLDMETEALAQEMARAGQPRPRSGSRALAGKCAGGRFQRPNVVRLAAGDNFDRSRRGQGHSGSNFISCCLYFESSSAVISNESPPGRDKRYRRFSRSISS